MLASKNRLPPSVFAISISRKKDRNEQKEIFDQVHHLYDHLNWDAKLVKKKKSSQDSHAIEQN